MIDLLKEGMGKIKEEGNEEKEWTLTYVASAKNDIIMEGVFSLVHKVLGYVSKKVVIIDSNSPTELENEI